MSSLKVSVKPSFHVSGKSQMIGNFTFCQLFQIFSIYWIIGRSLSQILPINNFGWNWMFTKNWNFKIMQPASFSTQQCSCTHQYKVFHSQKNRSWLNEGVKMSYIREYFWNIVSSTQLDAYMHLLGLPNVWIHNDGCKVYLCQVLCLYHKMNDWA